MVVICEQELKKRAEHNQGRLWDLEEISLHQLNIKKIVGLDKLCRNLKIIYLQDNSIQKIENLSRLKHLEYINLSMNAIEEIEGLQGCESLRKLDLTLNFIGNISSILALRENLQLEELFLTGNPCALFLHYKEYVITHLPHLKMLDGIPIERSERITAFQNIENIKLYISRSKNTDKKEKRRKLIFL